MALKKYKPLSPDPYVNKTKGDTEFARLAHLNDLVDKINKLEPASSSSSTVSFTESTIYGDPGSPITATGITIDDTNARKGVIQKMYHQAGVTPSIFASQIGTGTYSTTDLNILYFEWNGSYAEFWITQ